MLPIVSCTKLFSGSFFRQRTFRFKKFFSLFRGFHPKNSPIKLWLMVEKKYNSLTLLDY
jgi:hypothetical protein